MVSFQCDACSDVIKKPKLDQHHSRGCHASFTCIDCSKTFATPGDWKGHTSCISEEQKYQKSLYKPKNNSNSKRDQHNTTTPVTVAMPADKEKTAVVTSAPAEDANATKENPPKKTHKKRKSEGVDAAADAQVAQVLDQEALPPKEGSKREKKEKEKKEKGEKKEKKEKKEKGEKGEKKEKEEKKEKKEKKDKSKVATGETATAEGHAAEPNDTPSHAVDGSMIKNKSKNSQEIEREKKSKEKVAEWLGDVTRETPEESTKDGRPDNEKGEGVPKEGKKKKKVDAAEAGAKGEAKEVQDGTDPPQPEKKSRKRKRESEVPGESKDGKPDMEEDKDKEKKKKKKKKADNAEVQAKGEAKEGQDTINPPQHEKSKKRKKETEEDAEATQDSADVKKSKKKKKVAAS